MVLAVVRAVVRAVVAGAVVRAVMRAVEVATTAVAMRMRIVLAATSGGPWTKTPSILNVQ